MGHTRHLPEMRPLGGHSWVEARVLYAKAKPSLPSCLPPLLGFWHPHLILFFFSLKLCIILVLAGDFEGGGSNNASFAQVKLGLILPIAFQTSHLPPLTVKDFKDFRPLKCKQMKQAGHTEALWSR